MNVMTGSSLFLNSAGYQISRSVRLRSSASAYFNRTPASAGNRKTWTWSGWVKRGALSSTFYIFGARQLSTSTPYSLLYFASNDTLTYIDDAGSTLQTTQVFRDPSAWYHIVLAVDTTQATGSNRYKMYANGVQITAFGSAVYAAQNSDTAVNAAIEHDIGIATNGSGSRVSPFDGYLTEINFIDGQALTPSSFGETNAVTGVWQPKKYAGTYGTNGFYLNFSDNSAATAAAIGKDYSGNGNNWTPNNISVTAGVTYDSMLDVPTPWGSGVDARGNYCTLNPLVTPALSGGGTLSNGNLRIAGTVSVSNAYARGTMALSGKFYAEFFFDVVNATASIGVDVVTATTGALNTSNTNVSYRSGGNKRVLGTESAYGASWVANDIIGVAVDTAANTVEFFKNGVSQGVITSSAFFAQGDCVFAMSKDDIGSPTGFANFGQRPFSYTPPTGFKALNTLNLPTPTILKGNQYFNAVLWTGDNTNSRTITGVGFQPDLVWAKSRSNAQDNLLLDSVRGGTFNLISNSTAQEFAASAFSGGAIDSTASDGFTVVRGSTNGNNVNQSAFTYVAWNWKEGATQGFDIVTYTGDGVSSRTVAHSLGVTPAMIITKARSATSEWMVAHKSLGNGNLILNQTLQSYNPATQFSGGGLAAPNSSTTFGFVAGSGGVGNSNANGVTYVAYLFAAVAGYSAFGSYTGNGSADGPFLNLGFRPALIIVKSATEVDSWRMYDKSRIGYNSSNYVLYPNLSNAEGASTDHFDLLSNGAKIRSNNNNTNGQTYIYAAFAENPLKFSLAR
jgi:hypothetical protein